MKEEEVLINIRKIRDRHLRNMMEQLKPFICLLDDFPREAIRGPEGCGFIQSIFRQYTPRLIWPFHYYGWLEDGGFTSPVGKNDSPCNGEQYTGMRDKNGVEIYENDLLKWDGGVYQVKFEVYFWGAWKIGGGIYDRIDPPNWINHCTVIGNIHQNPELLETSNN